MLSRFKEKMRQGTHISKDGHHFSGTENERVKNTVKELDEFESKLKNYRKHLKAYSSATTDILTSSHKVLAAELPRVHDVDPNTGNAFGQPTQNSAGQSLNIHGLIDCSSRHDQQLHSEVFGPIDAWVDKFKSMQPKLKQLDNFRLDLDTARRMHGRSDLERVRSQQKNDSVAPELDAKISQASTEVEGKRQAHDNFEAQVHAELAQLVQEASMMHVVLAKALRIEADTLSSALQTSGGAGMTGGSGHSGMEAGMREMNMGSSASGGPRTTGGY